jgi:hypothetical protein
MHKALLCAILWLALPAHADLYRCIDATGRIHFTDRPDSCSASARVRLERELVVDGGGESPPPGPDTQQSPPAKAGIAKSATLSEHFIPGFDLIGDWSVIPESPEPIDSELRSRGLRDTATRHYTRGRGARSDVCTVELWEFSRAEAARRAMASLDLPNWKILRASEILILVHGVRLERGVGSRSDLVSDCENLGQQTYQRIARIR